MKIHITNPLLIKVNPIAKTLEDPKYRPQVVKSKKSYMHMIHTKYLRMRSLAENEDKEINFESLEDTLVDMAVYCAMFAAYLENKKLNKPVMRSG